MKVLQFPLTKVVIVFILGILFYKKYPSDYSIVFCCASLLLLILLLSHFLTKKQKLANYIFGIVALSLSFVIGILTAAFHKENIRSNHFTHLIQKDSLTKITFTIFEEIKPTLKNNRFIIKMNQINDQESFGKTILNIPKTKHSQEISIGSQITVYNTIYANQKGLNPNQFDYGNYLENQEIYGQLYLDEKPLQVNKQEKGIWIFFSNFRTKIIQNLERSGFKKEELSIILALLLGQRQDISPELLHDYQSAGAVHILSVSGLHVGFILLFVTSLLKPIGNSKKKAWIKIFIIIASLWSYGILAGLSASIVRSVTMFSFIALGQQLHRNVNSFHTLLVSMFLILLWKPSFLYDVGFQLSYLALFFILWLQPILSAIWQPNNKILNYFWDILTVSFAAQIGTLPVSLYYFHQFPGLFFVTNILVLPLLAIIMIVGLLTIIAACFGEVTLALVKPLEILIEIQNSCIHWVASFDRFVIKDIPQSPTILWLSYILIIAMVLWFKVQNFKRTAIVLLCIVALQIQCIYQKKETTSIEELIVYNIKKNTIISERKNNSVTIYSNDSILKTVKNNTTIKSYLVENFCTLKEKRKLENTLFYRGKKIMIIDSFGIYSKEIKPNIVIITNSPKLNLKRLLTQLKPEQIIVDGSNYRSYTKLWERTCIKEKIPFHDTNEKGFYKL